MNNRIKTKVIFGGIGQSYGDGEHTAHLFYCHQLVIDGVAYSIAFSESDCPELKCYRDKKTGNQCHPQPSQEMIKALRPRIKKHVKLLADCYNEKVCK